MSAIAMAARSVSSSEPRVRLVEEQPPGSDSDFDSDADSDADFDSDFDAGSGGGASRVAGAAVPASGALDRFGAYFAAAAVNAS